MKIDYEAFDKQHADRVAALKSLESVIRRAPAMLTLAETLRAYYDDFDVALNGLDSAAADLIPDHVRFEAPHEARQALGEIISRTRCPRGVWIKLGLEPLAALAQETE